MKRKPTPAQIAARERFAEMARSGAFKRKRNPAKKTVSQKISQLTREGYPQKQAIAIALSEQRAGKVKRNPAQSMQTFEIIDTTTGESEGFYKAADAQLAFEVWARSNGYKSFSEMKQKEKFGARGRFIAVESQQRKRNPRASNPIILVSDKPIKTRRKSNPAKPKRQRMLNISWLTAGGQREIMSVPIEFVFTHYVGNVAEKFFVRTEGGQLIVSEYSTGGRIGQVPYTMRAAALNDREAAKRYVAEMLSKIGAERFKTAVKKFDPIN